MNKRNIIIMGIILIILGVAAGFYYFKTDEVKPIIPETKEIKDAYEKLNGTTRESDNQIYQSISIDASIEVDNISALEAAEFVKSGTGILFIGAPWCPWCRNALPVLMETASANNLVIKYLDLTDVRNVYEIEDNKLIKTQKEGEGYYELLNSLDSVLGEDTYKLKDSDGKSYDTKEKRIYIPMAIAIKNGNIEGTHVSTVSLNDNQTKYSKLEDYQITELKNIYQDLINKTKGLNVCTEETLCD